MGELHDAIGRRGALLGLAVAVIAMGCGPVAPTGPVASSQPASQGPATTSGSPASDAASVTPELPAIDPAAGRLIWLVDRAGGPGVWTTDLAGGDVRPYLTGLDEAGPPLREPRLVGDDVVVIRDTTTAELWVMSPTAPPRLLLDAVETFVVEDDRTILAVRDEGSTRAIWRVLTDGTERRVIAELPLPRDGPELGPFGFAIAPDGRTVAAGWVGGSLDVMGPAPTGYDAIGAPLVVADDGRLVAVTGRAGEAYLLDGNRLVDLAPADSDPVALTGTGTVAWPSVGEDGALIAVEVRDLLAGTNERYPAGGLATNVRELTTDHVILEATAFDPVTRSVGVVDRRTGRFATFEASAPQAD